MPSGGDSLPTQSTAAVTNATVLFVDDDEAVRSIALPLHLGRLLQREQEDGKERRFGKRARAGWFQYSQSSRKQLAALCDCLKELPLAIEFNRSDWYRKRVVDGLRVRGVAMVSVQAGAAAMPAHAQVTAPFSYFRFMGRHIRYHLRGQSVLRGLPLHA